MLALLALVCYFIRCLAPSVAFGAQVLPAASYHSTIRYFIRCLARSVAFGAQVLPAAASYHSTIRLCNIFGSTNASHTSHIG